MEIKFYNIRSTTKGKANGFEELCCQLFYREFINNDRYFQRFRGDGGDGGVEAVFIQKNDTEIALQSKYWENNAFGSSQITQLTKSIDAAKQNHPKLSTYYISVPFNLTGPVASGKRGKSQEERFSEWQSKKEKEYSLNIVLWTESILTDLLLKHDATGGLRRYWFDAAVFTQTQYRQHIEDAVAQAGKRYTPELSVQVPLLQALDSFVNPDCIKEKVEQYLEKLEKDLSYAFEEVFAGNYGIERTSFSNITGILQSLLKTDTDYSSFCTDLEQQLTTILEVIKTIEKNLLVELKNKFGEDFQDTPDFRQFQAEYMCEFPAGKLDATREIIKTLTDIKDWLNSISVKLYFNKLMLIHGIAGIGKTHSVIDYIKKQSHHNLWIFFGEDFTGTEPWKIMCDKLGLDNSISRDELFEMMSTQAIMSDTNAVIFIDALNETPNREQWQKWLPVLAQQICRFPFLKLCVTCRDTFLDEVFENRDGWVEFSHNGFLGQEYLAIQEFFSFYQLKLPVMPLLQTEFRNPLFLHLVCESFHGECFTELPKGQFGLKNILQVYLTYKNKIIAKKCDYDPNSDFVKRVLREIALHMSETKRSLLEYTEVKKISDAVCSCTGFEKSLVNQLEKEGLLSFIEHKKAIFDSPIKLCRFTFERIADFFIAENVLNEYSNGEKLSNLLTTPWINENRGILEILAILLPEQKEHKEIIDYCNECNDIPEAFLNSFQWRNAVTLTSHTAYWVRNLLFTGYNAEKIFNTLISISIVPDSKLNAYFLNDILTSHTMCERDTYWTYYLINNYEQQNSARTLLNWACFSDVSNYNQESLFLWAIVLSWFLSCSDRRIRDQSSKGLTRILCANFDNCLPLLKYFRYIDDDYIYERVTGAIYAAFLLVPNKDIIFNLAEEIANKNYLEQFNNVIIRDNLRLIVEFACTLDNATADKINLDSIRHSHAHSCFIVPDESEYKKLVKNEVFNNPIVNMVNQWYTDFQRYILGTKIRIFDIESKNISLKDIYKWFLVELSNLGYPGPDDRCWKFDRYLIGKHGSGRGRPVYAERLGKKYYWILLHRLLGILQNTVPYKYSDWDDEKEPLQPRLLSLDVRKIDLTDLRYSAIQKYPEVCLPAFNIDMEILPKMWIESNDNFYNIPSIIKELKTDDKKEWIPLLYMNSMRKNETKDEYPYRECAAQFSTFIIQKKDVNKLGKDRQPVLLRDGIFDYIKKDYSILLGEYPFTRSCCEQEENGSWLLEGLITDTILGESTSFEMLRGHEWEYDCSFESESLFFPSKSIIQLLELKWDKYEGWLTQSDELSVFTNRGKNEKILLIKKSALQKLLGKEKILLFHTYNEKMYNASFGMGANGLHNFRGMYLYDGTIFTELQNYEDTNSFRDDT